jgi:hypothetical protein
MEACSPNEEHARKLNTMNTTLEANRFSPPVDRFFSLPKEVVNGNSSEASKNPTLAQWRGRGNRPTLTLTGTSLLWDYELSPLMKRYTVLEIIERSQMRHAMQVEREMKNLPALMHGADASGALVGKAGSEASLFETDEVRVSTVTIPGRAEWSPPHDDQDRLVVILDKMDQLLARDCTPASPARWAWVPPNNLCKLTNGAERAKTLMIVEFNNSNDPEISQNIKNQTKEI